MTATTPEISKLLKETNCFDPDAEAHRLVKLSIRNLGMFRLLQLTVPGYMSDPRYLALDAAQGGIDAAIAALRLVAALGYAPTAAEKLDAIAATARLKQELTQQG